MNGPTVVFDIDGVLADFSRAFTEYAKRHVNSSIPVTPTSMHEEWSVFPGMSEHDVYNTWRLIDWDTGFWEHIYPLAAFTEMRALGGLHSNTVVYFATARPLNAFQATRRWLSQYLPCDPTVVVTKKKGEFCRVVNAAYYIDDKSENVDCAIWLTDGRTKAYVRDHPYNRGVFAPHSSKAKRVTSVEQFIQEVYV